MKISDVTATLALIGVVGLAIHAFKKDAVGEQLVPKDAIVAFESVGCPKGWGIHSKSEGLFLANAGKYNDEVKHEFELYSAGGEVDHVHKGKTSTAPTTSGEDDKKHRRTGAHAHTFTTNLSMHLPPFYVVTFCKRQN